MCASWGAPRVVQLDLRENVSRDLSRAYLVASLRVRAQTQSSRSRMPRVLARADAIHFGRDVKASGQNDSGVPITNNFQASSEMSERRNSRFSDGGKGTASCAVSPALHH